jgi:phage repressor protein C with HTH and peptisase S24 domain
MTEVVDKVVDLETEVDNQNKPVAERLKAARSAFHMTQKEFAEVCGIPLPSLRDYELGNRVPGGNAIASIVRTGINANWLLTGEGVMFHSYRYVESDTETDTEGSNIGGATALAAREPMTGYVAIPIYNDVRASAGDGTVVEHEWPDDVLMLKEEWIRLELGAKPGDLQLIRVNGTSMEPTLRAGDMILINIKINRPDFEGIYVLRIGDGVLVKNLQLLPGGRIQVSSDNPIYKPFELSAEHMVDEVSIIGRVVWYGRKI